MLTVSQHVELGVLSGTIGKLNIDSAGTGAVVIVSATDSATALTIGSGGSGRFNQYGGSVTLIGSGSAPVLDIAAQTSGDGIYNMSGGTLAVIAGGSAGSAGPVIVGDLRSGDFNQTSGQVTFGGNLVVGNGSSGDGFVFLHGDSKTTLHVSSNITIGAQESAVGTFKYDEQNGQAKLILGSHTILTVGDAGSGTFVQGGSSVSAAARPSAAVSSISAAGHSLSAPPVRATRPDQ
jgi:hypothetical protein